MAKSSQFMGMSGQGSDDLPSCSCFLALAIAAIVLLVFCWGTLDEPGWNADHLGGLLMALMACSFSAMVLTRVFHWLHSHTQVKADLSSLSQLEEVPGSPVTLKRDRPTVSGVLLLWSLALFWNLPVAVAAAGAIQLVSQGRTSVALLIFVAFFAAMGILAIVVASFATLEEFSRLRGVPSAEVEVSSLPLRPGGSYEVAIDLRGPLLLETLDMEILCEEDVAYPDGEGDTYVKIEAVFRVQLHHVEAVRIEKGIRYNARAPFTLSGDVKPSRPENPGKARWKVVVKGRRKRWPLRFQFDYPITVVAAEVDSVP